MRVGGPCFNEAMRLLLVVAGVAGVLLEQLLLHVVRPDLVRVELHRVGRAPLVRVHANVRAESVSDGVGGGIISVRVRGSASGGSTLVIERREDTYWNMLASGTLARTTFMLPRSASSPIMPRLLLMSPITSPIDSSGVVTSTFISGSMSFAPAARRPLRAAALPAISNAITDESTSWKAPSTRVACHEESGDGARTRDGAGACVSRSSMARSRRISRRFITLQPMTGKPARMPEPMIDSRPFATPGMYSLGTAPPLISCAAQTRA